MIITRINTIIKIILSYVDLHTLYETHLKVFIYTFMRITLCSKKIIGYEWHFG